MLEHTAAFQSKSSDTETLGNLCHGTVVNCNRFLTPANSTLRGLVQLVPIDSENESATSVCSLDITCIWSSQHTIANALVVL